MLLTKDQHIKRKNSLLKAHQWFGNDFLINDLSKHYDIYIDNDNVLFYVYSKEA